MSWGMFTKSLIGGGVGFGKSPPPLDQCSAGLQAGGFASRCLWDGRRDALKRAPNSEPFKPKHRIAYPGGAPVPSLGVVVGSTMSVQVPRRRLAAFGFASAIAPAVSRCASHAGRPSPKRLPPNPPRGPEAATTRSPSRLP
jgi:hypothetical protein